MDGKRHPHTLRTLGPELFPEIPQRVQFPLVTLCGAQRRLPMAGSRWGQWRGVLSSLSSAQLLSLEVTAQLPEVSSDWEG